MIVAGATAAAIAAPMLRGSEGEGSSVGDVSSNTVETTVAAVGMESPDRDASGPDTRAHGACWRGARHAGPA